MVPKLRRFRIFGESENFRHRGVVLYYARVVDGDEVARGGAGLGADGDVGGEG